MAEEALRSTSPKANFHRLTRLLMRGGVNLLRETFDSIHSPADLPLRLAHPAMQAQLRGARLTQPEMVCLNPSPGVYGQSNDFDITLIFKLFRTICGLTPPAGPRGWDDLPNDSDHTLVADLVRIKYYRNDIYAHRSTMEISDIDFIPLWEEISEALLRIATNISPAKREEWEKSIYDLLHNPLTPDGERCIKELETWYKQDMDVKDELVKLREELSRQPAFVVIQMNVTEYHQAAGSEPTFLAPNLLLPQMEQAAGADDPEPDNPPDITVWNVILSFRESVDLFLRYLWYNLRLRVRNNEVGSWHITVECSSLQVLEGVWEDYRSGHLNSVAQEMLITPQVLAKLGLTELKLKTFISEDQYQKGKKLLEASSGAEDMSEIQSAFQATITKAISEGSIESERISKLEQENIKLKSLVEANQESRQEAQPIDSNSEQMKINNFYRGPLKQNIDVSTCEAMESPPTSPFASSIEKSNGEKLWNLVINEGGAALRKLLNTYHPFPLLATSLSQHKQTLLSLKRNKVLNNNQWEKLFPLDGTQPDCESFDITLLVILLTNICGLSPPKTGWNNKPPQSDKSTEANIASIRYYRNFLHHAPSTGVPMHKFNTYWEEIADALVALGLDRNEIDALKEEEELKKLTHFDFKGDINHYLTKFQDGTREWIFNKVKHWLDDRRSPHRAMLITAAAGMGKSVASAVICKRMQKEDRLTGCHFCQHSCNFYRDPKRMLQSLAYQLSSKLPEYKAALVKQLSSDCRKALEDMKVEDLFVWLFKEPLSAVEDPGRNVLVVIDALDESELNGRTELLDVIANYLSKLPLWIRFLITARPEKNISDKLRNLKIFKLQQEDEQNRDDIKTFFEKKLNSNVTNPDSLSAIVQELVHLSDGSMLFAYFLIRMIQDGTSPVSPEELRRQFPYGISSVYQSYFERMERRLKEELKDNYGNFLTDFLSALTVSEEPLHKEFIVDILLQNRNTSESDPLSDQRKLKGVIDCISSLFILREDHVHMFHKSIKDWLTDPSNDFFFVEEKRGHKILSKLCAKALEILKGRGGPSTQAKKKYASRHCVKHMLEACETESAQMEELVQGYVTDLELVYAKLRTEDTDVLKDLVLVQEHPNSRELSEEIHNTIESLLLQFKKNPKLLRDNPGMIFQNLLNEGESALYQQVSDTLLRSHPEIPYMELLDKNGHQGPVVGRFFCSDKVVCFDVSPDEKLLVSECRDGTTSLWSLETGKRLWEKALLKSIKSYNEVPLGSAFRQTCEDNETGKKTLSFYRSTVFHPDGCSILPGNLAKVYSLDGEPKSLFPGSKCHFNFCYFSGNKTRMLTDCPENAHQVVMWNTTNGEEIKRFESEETIASFAISQDGNRVAICNTSGSLWLQAVEGSSWKKAPPNISGEGNPCGLLHFTEVGALVCGSIQHELSDHRDKYKLSVPALQSQSSCVFLWPLESDDSVDRLKAVCKTSHIVSADLQIGFCLLLLKDLAVVGSPTVNYLTMLDITRPLKDEEMPRTAQAAFSTVNDSTRLYTTIAICNQGMKTDESRSVTFTMRDANNAREVKQEKSFQHSSRRVENGIMTVTVTYNGEKGVLLQTDSKTLEVWNGDLSQGLNSITMMGEIERLIPVSKDLVGCVLCTPKFSSEGQQELTIALFDVSAWKVVFERNLSGKPELKSIACSLQRGVVFCAENDVRKREMFFYRGEANVPIWREDDVYQGGCNWRHPHCVFSPQGDVVVTWNTLNDGYGLHALSAKTGMRKHVFLENCYDIADCRFLNDGETMVCYRYESHVRLFSVTSGEVLAVLDIGERPTCIGCSPSEPLIAVGLRFGNVIVIRAHVPKLRRANHKQRKA